MDRIKDRNGKDEQRSSTTGEESDCVETPQLPVFGKILQSLVGSRNDTT